MSDDGKPEKNWTMLVYMAGDNNLTEEMVWSLQCMNNTLETRPEINRKVGVIAQYDARGLNPRLLLLNRRDQSSGAAVFNNHDQPPGADGGLDSKTICEYGWRDVRRRVQERGPAPEHWAIAVVHHHERDPQFQRLFSLLESECSMTPAVAKQFVTALIMQAVAASRNIKAGMDAGPAVQHLGFPDTDGLAEAVAMTTTRRLEPTPEEYKAAREVVGAACHDKILERFCELNLVQLQRDKEVKDLAYRLARSTDSVIRNTRDLTSPLMVQDFIAGQHELITTHQLKAQHYIAVLSGHGGGATGDFLPDADPPSSLTIPMLGEILRNARQDGRSVDILGIDSCLMGMAEVAYEIQDSVDYLVASEGFVANAGWPYHRVLEILGGGEDPEPTAKGIVERYAAFYQDYEMAGSSTHMAALRLKAFGTPEGLPIEKVQPPGNLATAIQHLAYYLTDVLKPLDDEAEQEEFGAAARNSPGRAVRDALILAHWNAQSFKFEKYVDLWDFCDQLTRFFPNIDASYATKIIECCTAVKYWIGKAVVWSCYNGQEFQHAHGISVYFPWVVQDFSPEYETLKFARDTGWSRFLVSYLQKTRRLRRAHTRERTEPWRLGSDVEQLMQQIGSRLDSTIGTRLDATIGTRLDATIGTKMQGGKVVSQPRFKNVPDGFFRQDYTNPNRFFDRNKKVLTDRPGKPQVSANALASHE